MTFFLSFLSGFVASIIGIFPPGLINMTAAKTSIIDGRNRAMLFVVGALIVIFFQTYISIIFAQYINNHHEIVILLREIGFFIFSALAIYFLIFAKKPKMEQKEKSLQIKSKKSRFFIGMLISAINFFPIPYYVFVSVTLASYKFFSFDALSIFSFAAGTVIGSFAVFYCYVVFFNKMKSKTDFFVKNMNFIIGIITAIIALITLINILKYYLIGS